MSGLEGRKNLLAGVRETTKAMKNSWYVDVLKDAQTLSTVGKLEVQTVILNTPSAISYSKDNRYYTGQMYNAVGNDAKRTGTSFTARAGWIGLKRNYFAIQDQGGMGTGDLKNVYITPMNALRESKRLMTEEAKKMGYEIT